MTLAAWHFLLAALVSIPSLAHCSTPFLQAVQGGGSRTPATDVVCPMYARLPQLRALADLVDKGKETRPIMLCEYAHSMGNSTGE